MNRICVVTSTRAEYGLLLPLIQELTHEPNMSLDLVVTGTHLAKEFGDTRELIRADGVAIAAEIEILAAGDDALSTAQTMANALKRFADYFAKHRPDLLVVLGDRSEIFAISAAATVCNIPIAHLHGGETTQGAIDEVFRHSISKMSFLHFTANEIYRRRVIQLGEAPERVFNAGAIGLDNIRRLKLLSRDELAARLGVALSDPYFLVTFHPETLSGADPVAQVDEVCRALTANGSCSILTKANSDSGGRRINARLEDWAKRFPDKLFLFSSLGQTGYLSAMRHAAGVVGNSSSGIIEAPQFHIGTLNLGDRQKGRLAAESVVHCPIESQAILHGLEKITSREFTTTLKHVANPYGDGHTAARIMEILRRRPWQTTLAKSFFDLPPAS